MRPHRQNPDPTGRPLRVLSFDHALQISGITSWNCRSCAEFFARPELGIDWTCVAVTSRHENEEVQKNVPTNLRSKHAFVEKRFGDSNWSILPRMMSAHPDWASVDVILPNGVLAGWEFPDVLWRKFGTRPAVVGAIHNDMDIAYKMSGEGVSACDGVFAVSRYCQSEFQRQYPTAIAAEFLPYGVPVAATAPEILRSGPIQLVYCGRITQAQKRVLDLVPLVRHLINDGIDFQLHLIGDGPLLPTLQHTFAELAPTRVLIHGPLPASGVVDLMRKMHVILSVSDYEGTSISMLEAMGQGVVPVVTDIASGVRDVIEPCINGWIAQVGDMADFSRIIRQLCEDRADLARAAVQAWETIQRHYSISASSTELANMLHIVAARHRGPYHLRRFHPMWRPNRLEQPWLPNWLVRSLRQLRAFRNKNDVDG